MTRLRRSGLASLSLAILCVAQAPPASQNETGQTASPASSQPGRPPAKVANDLWSFPQGSVAFWAVGASLPAASESNPARLVVERGLNAMLGRALRVEGGGTSVVSKLLDPEVLKGRAYRACLLDLDASIAQSRNENGASMQITRLAGVLEIRGGAEHAQLIAAIQKGLDADEQTRRVEGGVARPLTLPGGIRGMAYSRAGEPDWREISWCSTESFFLVGFGAGSLERWLTAEATRDAAMGEWNLHRTNFAAQRVDGAERAFEAFVDVNAIRRRLPEFFANGTLGTLSRAWRVENARTVMVLARNASAGLGKGRALQVAAAWSSRAEKPGLGRIALLTDASAQSAAANAKDSWSLTMKPDWNAAVTLIGDTYQALSSPRVGAEFSGARSRYVLRRGSALQRVLARLGMATLASQPDADGVVVRIPLREAKLDLTKKEPSIEGDLREVFGVSDVAFDAGTKSWSLKLSQPDDKNALFPADFSWRLSKDGTALEGRWGNWSREGAKGTPSR